MSEMVHKFYIHSILAIYFMGTWGGGREKPFMYTEDQKKLLGLSKLEGRADRKVPLQPLHIGEEQEGGTEEGGREEEEWKGGTEGRNERGGTEVDERKGRN